MLESFRVSVSLVGQRQRRVKDMSGLGLVVELLPYIYKRRSERVVEQLDGADQSIE